MAINIACALRLFTTTSGLLFSKWSTGCGSSYLPHPSRVLLSLQYQSKSAQIAIGYSSNAIESVDRAVFVVEPLIKLRSHIKLLHRCALIRHDASLMLVAVLSLWGRRAAARTACFS
jgi:hypothetical protein